MRIYHASYRDPRAAPGRHRQNFDKIAASTGILLPVLHIGLGAVAAGGGFGVPFAVCGLVFDRLGASGHPLFGGGAAGGGRAAAWFGNGSENTPSTV